MKKRDRDTPPHLIVLLPPHLDRNLTVLQILYHLRIDLLNVRDVRKGEIGLSRSRYELRFVKFVEKEEFALDAFLEFRVDAARVADGEVEVELTALRGERGRERDRKRRR